MPQFEYSYLRATRFSVGTDPDFYGFDYVSDPPSPVFNLTRHHHESKQNNQADHLNDKPVCITGIVDSAAVTLCP